MEIVLAKKILKANDQIAAANRGALERARILAVNLVGSPGAGKTALLEALIPSLKGRFRLAVVEGDLATSLDAERIEAAGARSIQINTEGGCHLDASMVGQALGALDLESIDILFIENVGNLVCPAGFDLGERLRVVVLSVAEGDDKAAKYPPIFQNAQAVALNKIDLIEHTDFNRERFRDRLARLSRDVRVFELSAKTAQGVPGFADWLGDQRRRLLEETKE